MGASEVIQEAGQGPVDVVVADFNRDGLQDLAVALRIEEVVRWFHGVGEGKFEFGGEALVGIHEADFFDLPAELLADDLDGDGLTDLVVVNSGNPFFFIPTSPSVGVLYGSPEGGFEDFRPIGLSPSDLPAPLEFATSIVIGRRNRDGRPRLLLAHELSHVVCQIQSGPGRRWAPPILHDVETEADGPTDLALADLDFDGFDDLIVANGRDLQVWRGEGSLEFPQKTRFAEGREFRAVALADFDQDGQWDLVALDFAANLMRVFMGLGADGGFIAQHQIELAHGTGPVDLIVYDANLDGRDDVALIYNTSGGGEIYLGRSEGGAPLLARRFATSNNPRSLAKGDLNGDGMADLVIANEGDEIDVGNADLVLHFNQLDRPLTERLTATGEATPGRFTGAYLAGPWGLAWDAGRESLWTIDRLERELVRLSPAGEVFERIGFAELAGRTTPDLQGFPPIDLIDPTDIVVDADGGLWISDRLTGRLIRIAPDGALDGTLPVATSTGLERPTGVAIDPESGRIFVGGETDSRLLSLGADAAGVELRPGPNVRDLAWIGGPRPLLAITQDRPGELALLNPGAPPDDPGFAEYVPLGFLVPILSEQTARSVAFDVANGRMWILMESGALVQLTRELELVSIIELSLLREIRSIADAPEGGVWLADSGVLGTLVRFDPDHGEIESLQLNDPGDPTPIDVRGLAIGPDGFFVLDGRGREVHVFDRVGNRVDVLSHPALRPLRLRGLHVDPFHQRLLIGAPGRVIELALGTPDAGVVRPVIGDFAISATLPIGSISRGQHGSEIAIFSPERRSLVIHDEQFNRLKTIDQTRLFPFGFRPMSAAPAADDGTRWVFAGSGETTLLGASLLPPPSAAGGEWARYR